MIPLLGLTVFILYFGLSTSTTQTNHTDLCIEELNLKHTHALESPEIKHNRTCLAKCTYEKDGKTDSEGRLVVSNFPYDEQDAADECWYMIEEEDHCKHIQAVESCIYRRSFDDWERYAECEIYLMYAEDLTSDCYTRCHMIVDGSLNVNGSVNLSSIIMYERNAANTANHEDALEFCKGFVVDRNKCTYDLNMHNCVSYVLYHWSTEVMQDEIECAKENNVYPFRGTDNSVKQNLCYDRCLLIKYGELNADNILRSNGFTNFGMSQEEIHEAYSACNNLLKETDECTEDLYFYDCIRYFHNANRDDLKQQIDCASETGSPLVQFRTQLEENYCKTKCLMIKKNELDPNGEPSKAHLGTYTVDDSIIEASVEYCKNKFNGNDCAQQVFTQQCVISEINDEVYKKCSALHYKTDEMDDDEVHACSSRCYMIHGKQLGLEGEVLVESLLEYTTKTFEDIEKTVQHCKPFHSEANECVRDVSIYYCVYSAIRRNDDH